MSTNVCQKCWLNWNVCECQRVLSAGENVIADRVERLGGFEVWRQEWRRDHGLSFDWQVPCQAPGDGKCVAVEKCTITCRYFVPQ